MGSDPHRTQRLLWESAEDFLIALLSNTDVDGNDFWLECGMKVCGIGRRELFVPDGMTYLGLLRKQQLL